MLLGSAHAKVPVCKYSFMSVNASVCVLCVAASTPAPVVLIILCLGFSPDCPHCHAVITHGRRAHHMASAHPDLQGADHVSPPFAGTDSEWAAFCERGLHQSPKQFYCKDCRFFPPGEHFTFSEEKLVLF